MRAEQCRHSVGVYSSTFIRTVQVGFRQEDVDSPTRSRHESICTVLDELVDLASAIATLGRGALDVRVLKDKTRVDLIRPEAVGRLLFYVASYLGAGPGPERPA